MTQLAEILAEGTRARPVPGAGLAVVHDGRVDAAFTGVTSVDDPLPIDARTRFQLGSVSKTYAVSAVLRLATLGRLGLDDHVRDHVPDLQLADANVATEVRVRDLLNHTAGWDGTQTSGAADPETSLAQFVAATLPGLEQVGPLGGRAEYNNAAVALAGRVVEVVTGQPYERAMRELLLAPLGLGATAFTTDDLMTERCTVGHLADAAGGHRVARPWRWPRAGNPEGGLVSTLGDQLRWAQFHLDDGRGPDGRQLLDADLARAMRTSTMPLLGNPMGDAVGLGWFLRDVGGEATAAHAGATNGQFCELRLVPGHGFGVLACANADPAGTALVRDLVLAVLAERLDLREEPARFRAYDPTGDGDVRGTYRNSLASLEVEVAGDGVRLTFVVGAVYAATLDEVPRFDPVRLRFLADGAGRVVADGAFEGSTGAFTRSGGGEVDEVAFGGRWYRRADR